MVCGRYRMSNDTEPEQGGFKNRKIWYGGIFVLGLILGVVIGAALGG